MLWILLTTLIISQICPSFASDLELVDFSDLVQPPSADRHLLLGINGAATASFGAASVSCDCAGITLATDFFAAGVAALPLPAAVVPGTACACAATATAAATTATATATVTAGPLVADRIDLLLADGATATGPTALVGGRGVVGVAASAHGVPLTGIPTRVVFSCVGAGGFSEEMTLAAGAGDAPADFEMPEGSDSCTVSAELVPGSPVAEATAAAGLPVAAAQRARLLYAPQPLDGKATINTATHAIWRNAGRVPVSIRAPPGAFVQAARAFVECPNEGHVPVKPPMTTFGTPAAVEDAVLWAAVPDILPAAGSPDPNAALCQVVAELVVGGITYRSAPNPLEVARARATNSQWFNDILLLAHGRPGAGYWMIPVSWTSAGAPNVGMAVNGVKEFSFTFIRNRAYNPDSGNYQAATAEQFTGSNYDESNAGVLVQPLKTGPHSYGISGNRGCEHYSRFENRHDGNGDLYTDLGWSCYGRTARTDNAVIEALSGHFYRAMSRSASGCHLYGNRRCHYHVHRGRPGVSAADHSNAASDSPSRSIGMTNRQRQGSVVHSLRAWEPTLSSTMKADWILIAGDVYHTDQPESNNWFVARQQARAHASDTSALANAPTAAAPAPVEVRVPPADAALLVDPALACFGPDGQAVDGPAGATATPAGALCLGTDGQAVTLRARQTAPELLRSPTELRLIAPAGPVSAVLTCEGQPETELAFAPGVAVAVRRPAGAACALAVTSADWAQTFEWTEAGGAPSA